MSHDDQFKLYSVINEVMERRGEYTVTVRVPRWVWRLLNSLREWRK